MNIVQNELEINIIISIMLMNWYLCIRYLYFWWILFYHLWSNLRTTSLIGASSYDVLFFKISVRYICVTTMTHAFVFSEFCAMLSTHMHATNRYIQIHSYLKYQMNLLFIHILYIFFDFKSLIGIPRITFFGKWLSLEVPGISLVLLKICITCKIL